MSGPEIREAAGLAMLVLSAILIVGSDIISFHTVDSKPKKGKAGKEARSLGMALAAMALAGVAILIL